MSPLSAFNTTDATYKTVDGVNIDLSILTWKDISPGRHPIIVRFHGGFLVTGSRLYEDWFPKWILEYAVKTQAILISADYRLMPEAGGMEILSDIRSLFKWISTDLPFFISTLGIEADKDTILVTGESAGGYLAVQSALLQSDVGIKAVICAYGVLDIKTPFFTQEYEKTIVGTPNQPRELLDNHLKDLKDGAVPSVVSWAESNERELLALSVVQTGRYVELLGDNAKLFPLESLDRREDGEVPPMWIFHGKKDTAVPVEGSQVFAEKLKTVHPATDILLTLEDGQEHGFDRNASMDAEWLKSGLEFIDKHWPGE